MQLYLITGFLGVGKTTFLRNFIGQFAGKKLHLIINEFGKTSVDGALLKEIDASMKEIHNGSIFCACRLNEFEEALKQAIADKPDVIIVETSGLSDPTNVHMILERSAEGISYEGCVCLADASRFLNLISALPVCAKQISVASLVLINKVDLVGVEVVGEIMQKMQNLNPTAVIRATEYGKFATEWLDAISPMSNIEESKCAPDITLQKTCLSISKEMSFAQCDRMLNMVCEATYRMKGFVLLNDGKTYLVDCVGSVIRLSECEQEVDAGIVGKINLLAGKGMPLRQAVKEAREWYSEYIIDCE